MRLGAGLPSLSLSAHRIGSDVAEARSRCRADTTAPSPSRHSRCEANFEINIMSPGLSTVSLRNKRPPGVPDRRNISFNQTATANLRLPEIGRSFNRVAPIRPNLALRPSPMSHSPASTRFSFAVPTDAADAAEPRAMARANTSRHQN